MERKGCFCTQHFFVFCKININAEIKLGKNNFFFTYNKCKCMCKLLIFRLIEGLKTMVNEGFLSDRQFCIDW